ncbi:MAG: GtrA family protein [Hymenobacter sp.]|nr:MAG: GtrA family protein [Hymenobacter sp.]
MNFSRFLKAQAAALAGTAVDFLVTICLVEGLRLGPVLANALGNIAGGLTNFQLGRHHVFRVAHHQAAAQGLRYLLVWAGSLLLNAGGMYALTSGAHANYLVSKIVVSLLVGFGFNYPLHLHFVFRTK